MNKSIEQVLSAGTVPTEPAVGMGATVHLWTDQHAYTIVKVTPDGNRIHLQRDIATRVGERRGRSEPQQYAYAADPDGEIVIARRRRNFEYRTTNGNLRVTLGRREEYWDPGF